MEFREGRRVRGGDSMDEQGEEITVGLSRLGGPIVGDAFAFLGVVGRMSDDYGR